MNRRTIWLLLGGFVLLLLALPLVLELSQTATEGEIDRYRTAAEITIADGDRTVSNKVFSDCTITRHSNWNTGTQVGTSHQGSDPFVVLSDRSILILRDLNRCPDGKIGETYTYDPDVQSTQIIDRRIRAPYAHASCYDNVDDAKTLTLYRQQELFRGGVDGLRVTEAKLVIVERKPATPLPDGYGDAFPWYKKTPRGAVGTPEYSLHDHASRFSGFIVGLSQLGEKQRCEKFDRESEGPILVTTDRWDDCLPWGGSNMGWLVAKPNADLSQIDYSYNERSTDMIATQYRATWLEVRGAPGANEGENYFFWRPKICIDGQCFATQAARRSTWEGFRLYYPKKNQVVTVEWKH
jgi:hypothetical protein